MSSSMGRAHLVRLARRPRLPPSPPPVPPAASASAAANRALHLTPLALAPPRASNNRNKSKSEPAVHRGPVVSLFLAVKSTRNNTVVTLSEWAQTKQQEEYSAIVGKVLGPVLQAEKEAKAREKAKARVAPEGLYEDSAGALPGEGWKDKQAIVPLGEAGGPLITPEEHEKLLRRAHPQARVIVTHSGGTVGFRRAQRETFEAAYQVMLRIFQTIKPIAESADIRLEIKLAGFGAGREAVMKAFMGVEGEEARKCVTRITDSTPIKIGGVRAKKLRKI
ncbi:translational machinery component [Calocera viscosa TUFC12733]|uniref:Translational machinery component n=1 Tax=Calocera viscosa (strain TUFC12733) TaxID=1330018 RepID=A0A167M3B7_CALVF|nr:translational machinery component [Calocera viscosa TUFC12733]